MKPRIPANLLLDAYARGLFPMGMETGEIGWFCPALRGVFLPPIPDLPHGIRRDLRRRPWEFRVDTCFDAVMEACADREETWISGEIFASYGELHRLGFAHSLEVWLAGRLVGGLYGVHLGGVFFGESMFFRESGASKAALVCLLWTLWEHDFGMVDTQWLTPHLQQFGAIELKKETYLRQLEKLVLRRRAFPREFRLPPDK